jgi:hypothetical protein
MDLASPSGIGMNRFTLLLASLAAAAPLSAQDDVRHLLVITGLSGDPAFRATFASQGGAMIDAAAGWGISRDRAAWLAEDAELDPGRSSGRSTREAIDTAFADLARRSSAGDVVAILLIGHGSGDGATSRIGLPGPDPTASDYATWLNRLAGRRVVFVVAGSGSGDFLPVLKGAGRVVITATKSSVERNESVFATHFVHGLVSREADADKDGRVTIQEAFDYADREVDKVYSTDRRLRTEHPLLDDTGGGAAAGVLARRLAFGAGAVDTDPRVMALLAERREIESKVESLRRRRDSMSPSQYERELEDLLVAIAERTRAIRAIRGGER